MRGFSVIILIGAAWLAGALWGGPGALVPLILWSVAVLLSGTDYQKLGDLSLAARERNRTRKEDRNAPDAEPTP